MPISNGIGYIRGDMSAQDIAELVADRSVMVLQTSDPAGDDVWKRLNDELFPLRPDLTLRVWGHYGGICDLVFLRHMTNVRRFSADCLMKAVHVEAVCDLKDLHSLSLGIFDLDSFDFLRGLPAGSLRSLSLMATKSKKPDLAILNCFPSLTSLFIEGQQRGFDAISELHHLRDLCLRSVDAGDLGFVRTLARLESLDLKLGRLRTLEALRGNERIRYLEIWMVKGVSDISPIGEMSGLQWLHLESLKAVTRLPDLAKLVNLRRITLDNLKGMEDLSSLGTALALEEFAHFCAQGRMPEDYNALFSCRMLKLAWVGFGSQRKIDAFAEMAKRHGVGAYERAPFIFR